ncbi:pseudouridine synthase, related [Neospora caninum Liverpool]|uniref:Pseudouridine synthase, related n=1 Tax=Neospora caninum (strain Liverpool) TaxID=572307 RepID=F0VCG3_NEOCL|nr:pseudouridine synthase, related [Neospora caninum Liverpool]CBZ51285.1 pseudouridine synthase, related [Neospora caninum Liverpool]|eukprot:XP_003881318.1 pseudouridine synthase, related [Neospora caninum Liverpool]
MTAMLGRTLQLGRTNFEWLARRLSLAGVLSRREAEKAIAAGQVTVNGETICQNVEVCSEAIVCYKGAFVPPPVMTPQLFGLVKPRRVLCVMEEREDMPTLHTLMRHLYVEQDLLPDEVEDLERERQGRPQRKNLDNYPPTHLRTGLPRAGLRETCEEISDSAEDSVDECVSAAAQTRGAEIGGTRQRRHAHSAQSDDMRCRRTVGEGGIETGVNASDKVYANSLEQFVDRRFRLSTRLQYDTQPVLAELPRHLIVVRPLPVEADGFVLLTNDGDFAHAVQKPENRVQSVFDVRVSGTLPSYRVWESWRCGVASGGFDFGPVWVELLRAWHNAAWLRLHLVERPGMDLRMLLSSIGLKLRRLRRYAIGPYRASSIPQHTVLPLKFHSSFSRLLPLHRQLQHQAAAAAEARICAGQRGAAAADAAAARAAAEKGTQSSGAATPPAFPPRRAALFPAAGELKGLLEQNQDTRKERVGGWCIFDEVKRHSALALGPQNTGLERHARLQQPQEGNRQPLDEAGKRTATADQAMLQVFMHTKGKDQVIVGIQVYIALLVCKKGGFLGERVAAS